MMMFRREISSSDSQGFAPAFTEAPSAVNRGARFVSHTSTGGRRSHVGLMEILVANHESFLQNGKSASISFH